MLEQFLSNVTVLLFDSVRASRYHTRNSLLALGVRDLGLSGSLDEAECLLAQIDYDLLILDAAEYEDRLCDLIRDLRHGRLGRNPFAVVLATSWNHSVTLVRKLVDAGADDVILRPVSTGVLQTRIRQQVDTRKPFVVTSTYIGPDRRHGQSLRPGEAGLEVPNSLREKLVVNASQAMIAGAVAKARAAMSRRRIELCAFKIGVHCALILDMPANSDDVQAEVGAMKSTIADLTRWANSERFAAILPHCEMLAKLAEKTGFAPDNLRDSLIQLAAEARAVQRKLNPRKDDESLKVQIDEAAKRYKARRAMAAGTLEGLESGSQS